MAETGRSSKEVNVAHCSYLEGKYRFPKKDGSNPPPIASYRNNLTALSHYRNLLFVAYVDKIHVFQPHFPTQIIPSEPKLILDPPITRPGLPGYIDRHRPHAINQLVVGDLGNEELLVVACDDGDVVAYTTRSIYNAIDEDLTHEEIQVRDVDPVRAFFVRNVGMSAWGLAIHKAARLIAVSSNLQQITVFAFALNQSGSSKTGSDHEYDSSSNIFDSVLGNTEWVRVKKCSPYLRALCNWEIVLEGHLNNIPNIAFCNTELDDIGHYLVSTDISGSILVWDIWEGIILLDVSEHFRVVIEHDPWDWGWAVACVDPRSCRLADPNMTFGGLMYRKGWGERGYEWDDYVGPQTIRDSSQLHPVYGLFLHTHSMVEPEESYIDSEGEELEFLHNDEGHDQEEESSQEEEEDSLHDENAELEDESPEDEDLPVGPETDHPSPPAVSDAENPLGNMPTVAVSSPSPISLPFYILHSSKTAITLASRIHPPHASTHTFPSLFQQNIPITFFRRRPIWRINMMLQIPTLSLIAVANQVGRVALITMTRMRGANEVAGARVEWLLPFQTQEASGMRPGASLMGMAVGPVQGMETETETETETAGEESSDCWGRQARKGGEEEKRYRLFMMYYDHTVLTYEIWRDAGDAGVLVI